MAASAPGLSHSILFYIPIIIPRLARDELGLFKNKFTIIFTHIPLAEIHFVIHVDL